MGNADEGLGSLPSAPPPQLRDTVLGDDVADASTESGDDL